MKKQHLNLSKHTNGGSYAKSLQQYLSEISKKDLAPLTSGQEHELFQEYHSVKTNNPVRALQIRNKIIASNLRFVITIAKQYEYPKAKREDLVSEGNIGLFRAFDKFDYLRGYRFLTFANYYINLQINDYIKTVLADIVQPGNRQRVETLMNKAEMILRKKGNHTPTYDQLIEVYNTIKDPTDLQLDVRSYNEIKMQKKDFSSMSQTLGHDNDGDMTLGDTFRSNVENNADYEINKEETKMELDNLLHRALNPLEIEIVEFKLGLNGKEQKTLEQIADIIDRQPKYTRARIGQIYEKALEKLREHKNKVKELCGVQGPQLAVNHPMAALNPATITA